MWLSAYANMTGLLQCMCGNYNLVVYLTCSEIFVPCNIFTRFVRYTVILSAVQVFAMWFSLLLLDMFADLLINTQILLIPRTVYRMWQLSCRKCSNFLYEQVETKWRIWCNTVLKHLLLIPTYPLPPYVYTYCVWVPET